MNRKTFLLAFVVGSLLVAPTHAAPCDCSPSRDCSCACSCHNTQGGCSVEQKCRQGERANCSCSIEGCSSSCSSPADVIESTTLFYNFNLVEANLLAVGDWVINFDSQWNVVLAKGLSSGEPTDREYDFGPGVGFETLLDTLAGDFGACADVDWDRKRVDLRVVGNCS